MRLLKPKWVATAWTVLNPIASRLWGLISSDCTCPRRICFNRAIGPNPKVERQLCTIAERDAKIVEVRSSRLMTFVGLLCPQAIRSFISPARWLSSPPLSCFMLRLLISSSSSASINSA